MKRCPKCKKHFPPTNEFFGNNKSRDDKLTVWCKECRKLHNPNPLPVRQRMPQNIRSFEVEINGIPLESQELVLLIERGIDLGLRGTKYARVSSKRDYCLSDLITLKYQKFQD